MAALTTYGTSGLLATTIANYIPTLQDNIFTSKPLLFWLQSKGRVKPFSGTKIVQPLLYAENPNAGVYADADTFATAAMTGISAAEYEFRQYYGLVHFTGIELEKNSGKQALLSLVDARLKQLELTISENLDELLFTGTDSSKSWLGLVTVMSASNTVGDIAQGSYSWWRPTLDTDSEALSLATMRRLYNSASSGNDHPDGIFTTMAAFEAYENLIDDNARFLDPKMADAGFQSLMFKGAPMTFDTYCTTGAMNFLNSRYITLARMPNVWFKVSDWLVPTNADVQYKHIRCYGNLVFSNLKRQAAATALSNT
jgi:hypothetical protein